MLRKCFAIYSDIWYNSCIKSKGVNHMNPINIFMFIALGIICILACVFLFSYASMKRTAVHYQTVASVAYSQKSKVPFLYNYVVTYTRKGKPYQASTGLVFKNKIPKIGAKHMYDIVTYSSGGKKLIQAKKLKRQMSKA